MIKVHRDIEINTPDVLDPRVMAINLKVHGFNIRVVNGYSPTNCDGSEYQKETFYRLLTKSSIKENLVQILDSTASETLPKKSKSKSSRELWKDGTVLNDLLKRRTQSDIQSLEH